MKAKASDLIFISQINRDGSGTSEIPESYLTSMLENSGMKDELFTLSRISISEETYIASGFNSFVVKVKDLVDLQRKNTSEYGTVESSKKVLTNLTTQDIIDNASDVVQFGNPDTYKLIRKAASQSQGWMKSTKAMEIEGVGCVIQVTTQQGDNVAEAVTFVPNVRIHEETDDEGKVTSRQIVGI